MTKLILFEAHEVLAHPGQLGMYMFVRRMYFWKNVQKDVNEYVRKCEACNKASLREPKYADFTTSVPRYPMANIAMDLMGPFLPTTKGNTYILSCMDLLTHFLFLVPILNKQAEMVVTMYTDSIFAVGGESEMILSDRGSEFRAETFNQVTSQLGIHQVFTSLYTPTANLVLERAHGFIKQKLIAVKLAVPGVQWDEVMPQFHFAYNISLSTAAGESPFFLYFGRDPIIPRLSQLLQSKMRYMGHKSMGLLIDAMYIIYQETVANLVRFCQSEDPKINVLKGKMFAVNNMVLLCD